MAAMVLRYSSAHLFELTPQVGDQPRGELFAHRREDHRELCGEWHRAWVVSGQEGGGAQARQGDECSEF